MTRASEIIERCGGPKTVADWVGLDRTGVQRWTYPVPKGTGERVPDKHWGRLIAKAHENGVRVRLIELVPEDAAAAEARAAAAFDRLEMDAA